MRITIDTDGAGDATPGAAPGTTGQISLERTGPAAVDEASAADVARRTGATNAGAAPSGPGAAGASTAPGLADFALQWTGASDSAGPAPIDRG